MCADECPEARTTSEGLARLVQAVSQALEHQSNSDVQLVRFCPAGSH